MKQITDIPDGQCPFCGGPITDAKVALLWSGKGLDGGFSVCGLCRLCDIDFGVSARNGLFGAWGPDAPELSEMKTIVGEDELPTLSMKFDRYATLGPKWRAFLARRRDGDEVWRFGSADGFHNGFAVVRGGRPVSRFVVFGPA